MHLLIDFDSDVVESFDLSSTIRIRRIKKVEKYAQYEKGRLVPTWGQGLGIGREGRLFFASECLGTSSEGDREELDRLSACLLLFKPDPKSDNRLSSFETEYGGGGNTANPSLPLLVSGELETGKSTFPTYFLKVTELDDFKKFWLQLTTSAWHRTLIATSRRLLRSQTRVGRESDEDRLVDFMTAFEALILEWESSKAATIGRRISKLLQFPNSTQEQRAKERLELAYKMRNDALHDGQFSAANITAVGTRIDLFLTEIEQLLRKAMFRYVEQMNLGNSKADIIKKFD